MEIKWISGQESDPRNDAEKEVEECPFPLFDCNAAAFLAKTP